MRTELLSSVVLLFAACGIPGTEAGLASSQAGQPDVADLGAAATDAALGDDSAGPPDMPASVEQRSVFERGSYNVGHRRWKVTYDAVLEPGREIKLSVWYPTLDEDGEPGTYLVTTERPEVFGGATVALTEPAPVLIFSHGNSSLAEQSFFMTEFFASHGWVVAAPYHTGNTILDDTMGVNFRSAPFRPQDIKATLDELYGLPESDPLHGLLSDDVVMSGHSFGGFTTLAVTGGEFAIDAAAEACSEPSPPELCDMLELEGVEDLLREGFHDERIDVGIPQAPGGFFAYLGGLGAITVPTLLFTGALDRTTTNQEEGDRIWAALQGRHTRIDLRAGGHFTFSNMCTLLPNFEVVADDGCGEEFIDPEIAYDIVNAYSLAFARRTLWGDTSNDDLLRGVDDRYGEHLAIIHKPGSELYSSK